MQPHKTHVSRRIAAAYGRQAVAIIEAGQYRAPSGAVVEIADMMETAVASIRSYPPGSSLPMPGPGYQRTEILVENDTTLAAARRLIDLGHHPVVLNFASATHPGGGFLSGARAQEEYLVRSSGLYACLAGNPMYSYHRSRCDPLYTDYAIYSPGVPVFRSDDGELLESPYCVAVITCAAVNAEQLDTNRKEEIGPAMWSRILKVLAIGAVHRHDAIVLGAWGCGAFANDSHQIAGLFIKALQGEARGYYRRVVFAILDWSAGAKFIGPFLQALGRS